MVRHSLLPLRALSASIMIHGAKGAKQASWTDMIPEMIRKSIGSRYQLVHSYGLGLPFIWKIQQHRSIMAFESCRAASRCVLDSHGPSNIPVNQLELDQLWSSAIYSIQVCLSPFHLSRFDSMRIPPQVLSEGLLGLKGLAGSDSMSACVCAL